MTIFFIGCAVVLAYLLGSIPTAVLYGKRVHGIDVREYGSGNSGATNTFRVLGKRAGTIVLMIDMLKGATAASLAHALFKLHAIPADRLIEFQLLLGIVAIVGHIFPIYTNFKGGKGVATLLGMMLAIQPVVALLCVVIFLVILISTKYVSLGSLLATLCFPLLLLLRPFRTGEPLLIAFGFVMFTLLAITHQKNIRRLLNGNESRTYLFVKKD
uniref:Glycerol-3-phosphate acyltransferase n=1 Tax=Roseihalotalea indica TaxID=2867963 RepID=A0AA49GR90_9BACT|nr:glycerol-3-phosphate 1-O-acyltransferase PlsY [Tunicatimonas sp. TK19036]